ncbi:HCO3 transporter family-domain-containing protein [Triangularia verruculosa]|uniref:HCO3 transporter family-domain-containing protein n=1 Tax=Triangularia verruculosa TaxID=2587418 RepID=A0AAN6XNG2_9PEZI|nr:HCO3 transporter family-domain-containing protein [Triangularia verruculosa]
MASENPPLSGPSSPPPPPVGQLLPTHTALPPSPPAPTTTSSPATIQKPEPWYKIHLGRGMYLDVKRRLPYYWSDWTDAWDYRVVPATVYMFFANILPALAFSLDMLHKTDGEYGVNETLLASVLGAVVFSLGACQPIVIVGVTGPITVFNYTVYNIMKDSGTYYLGFMCWIGLWSLVFHWILAVTNSCNWLSYVTRFPCDIFGFYVALIYLQKGVQILETLGDGSPFWLSVVVSLLVFCIAYICGEIGTKSTLFKHWIRVFIKDYGTPLTVIFFTGFAYMPRMKDVPLETLPTSIAFMPTVESRGWFVHFWDLPLGHVFLAIPFAILLTVLFWFDHNVSSLIAQGSEYPLRKPAGFHWDLFLLGLTTGISGLLGLPFPNGLIPQAPFHTESLCVTEIVTSSSSSSTNSSTDDNRKPVLKATHVVEQRVSNLAQGLITLIAMTGPLLSVLHLIPQGVLAGLFFIMGFQALEGNGITLKLVYLLQEKRLRPRDSPFRSCPDKKIWLFVGLELLGFAATFAITQTVAAVGFPIFIILLIPVRAMVLPRWLSEQELGVLDGPTASEFTMVSCGGNSFGGKAGGSGNENGQRVRGVLLEGEGDGEETDGEMGGGRRKKRRSEEELAEMGESTGGLDTVGAGVRRRLSRGQHTGDGISRV